MSSGGGLEIEVTPTWLIANEESRERILNGLERKEWIRAETMKMNSDEPSLGDERLWCDMRIFYLLCEQKRIVNEHSSENIERVRARANPHEPLLKNKIMIGRMSLLLASIDRVFDFLLTDENIDDAETKRPLEIIRKGLNIDREKDLFYFAESQSMNMAFASQYILMRKGFYNAKCFIPRSGTQCSPVVSLAFLDTNKRDFNFSDFPFCPFTFTMRRDFTTLILRGTRNKGVHLYAGFTHNRRNPLISDKDQSRGDQGQKELMFRDSYVGQLLYASSLVREGGKAILQFIDTNTSTTVAVIYLAHIIFNRVSIYKPNMSRPGNAEKFLICDGLRSREAKAVHQYLKNSLDSLKPDESIRRLIPDRIIEEDDNFFEYFMTANNCLAERQLRFLQSYIRMLNDDFRENTHQENCLRTCLPYYIIPYLDAKSKTEMWRSEKNRLPEEVLSSILPDGINKEDILISLSNCRIVKGRLNEMLNNNHRLLFSPCADNHAKIIVVTRNGLFSLDDRGFVQLSKDSCILPPDTMLLTDRFEINNGRSLVVRILDAALIYGDNISMFPLKKRLLFTEKMAEACRKDGFKQNVQITVASYKKVERNWKPDENSSQIIENPYRFKRVYSRIVEDSSNSFVDFCRGERVYEI